MPPKSHEPLFFSIGNVFNSEKMDRHTYNHRTQEAEAGGLGFVIHLDYKARSISKNKTV